MHIDQWAIIVKSRTWRETAIGLRLTNNNWVFCFSFHTSVCPFVTISEVWLLFYLFLCIALLPIPFKIYFPKCFDDPLITSCPFSFSYHTSFFTCCTYVRWRLLRLLPWISPVLHFLLRQIWAKLFALDPDSKLSMQYDHQVAVERFCSGLVKV